jgi:hypothetical protein
MHNCNATRDSIAELLLDGTAAPPELLTELQCCDRCREEFDVLKETLKITTTMLHSASPSEHHWSAYEERLKQRLVTASASAINKDQQPFLLSRIPGMSIRVPLPIGALVLLIFGVALVFVARAATPPAPAETLIVTVPVEVPVVQEKVVTRTVYRDRYRSTVSRKVDQAKNKVSNSTVAKSEMNVAGGPQSLLGFKPFDEIKLTVIKRGSTNDK